MTEPRARQPQGLATGAVCSMLAPPRTVLRGRVGAPAMVAVQNGFLIAAATGAQLAIARVSRTSEPRVLGTFVAEIGSTPPVITRSSSTSATLLFAARGKLYALEFDPESPAIGSSTRTIVEEGVDPRFSPTVFSSQEREFVAFTDGSATPMKVRIGVLARTPSGLSLHMVQDVVPPAGGASAPQFVLGLERPELTFLDARRALSVAHRVRLDAAGAHGEFEVLRPLSRTAEPPRLVSVALDGATLLAYTAVGSLATRAIGLTRAGSNEDPQPLASGVGYGPPLRLEGLALERNVALFAFDAPSGSAANASREVRLARAGIDGAPTVQTLRTDADAPTIALDGTTVGIAYRSEDEVLWAALTCAQGPNEND